MRVTVVQRWRSEAVVLWEARTPRERALIAIAGALVALTVIVLGIWRPMQAARAEALADITTYEAVAAQVRAAGPALASGPAVAPAGSPSTVVASTAANFGISVTRIEPEGARTRVVLEDADFAAIVRWLEELERGGLKIAELRVERRPAPGLVNAQLLLSP